MIETLSRSLQTCYLENVSSWVGTGEGASPLRSSSQRLLWQGRYYGRVSWLDNVPPYLRKKQQQYFFFRLMNAI